MLGYLAGRSGRMVTKNERRERTWATIHVSGKRSVGVLGIALALVIMLCPGTAEAKFTLIEKVDDHEMKLQFYGFSQLEIRGGEGGMIENSLIDDGGYFTAQRIRWGADYFNGPIAGKLFVDFNQSFTESEAGLIKAIKDAFVAYRVSNAFMVRLGMIKTPLGMAFTVPGWNLDIAERASLQEALVLERDMGLTISGRLIGGGDEMQTNGLEMGNERQGKGFGYDLFVGNPAGRSSSVTWMDGAMVGDALSYVGRLHFDMRRTLHVEAAYGVSEKAGGTLTSGDYAVWDVGAASWLRDDRLELKLEVIGGDGINGEKDRTQTTGTFTFGFLVRPSLQVVLKTYQSNAERVVGGSKVDTQLGNTYLGLNWFLARVSKKHRDLQRNKIVFNYVFVNGDDLTATTPWNGQGGYVEDTWIVQWQFKY